MDVIRVGGFGWSGWKARVSHPGGRILSILYGCRLDAEAFARRFRDPCR